ncbi:uncharacterized protein LOC126648028 [Myiozetetes cayanensis]|uniref:uncharacterized protein LOC126648028 n=1 Tax=Myiozetetes cayanensis TaxID=478635 RepID=UPI00215DDB41|nr:uncharacterized protein LOC126648028 [Myiozetetes cayanensis]
MESPATQIVFCKDGVEVSSLKAQQQQGSYSMLFPMTRWSTGTYTCGYHYMDNSNRLRNSALSAPQILSVSASLPPDTNPQGFKTFSSHFMIGLVTIFLLLLAAATYCFVRKDSTIAHVGAKRERSQGGPPTALSQWERVALMTHQLPGRATAPSAPCPDPTGTPPSPPGRQFGQGGGGRVWAGARGARPCLGGLTLPARSELGRTGAPSAARAGAAFGDRPAQPGCFWGVSTCPALGMGRVGGAGAVLVVLVVLGAPPAAGEELSGVFQWMLKLECHFIDGSDRVRLVERFIYNREQLVHFDSDLGHFVGDTPFGEIQAKHWNSQPELLEQGRVQVDTFCRHNYEVSTPDLESRRVPPSVSISLVPSSSQPGPGRLLCSVMDFYPAPVQVRWFQDGQEVPEHVMATDVVPNGDWTYQVLVMLEIPPRRGVTYTCQVEHVSLEHPLSRHWEMLLDTTHSKMLTGFVGFLLGFIFLVLGLGFYLCQKEEKCQQNLCSGHEESRLRLLRELRRKVPWENTFAGAGVHHCWPLLKHHLLRAQEQRFPNVGSQAGETEGGLAEQGSCLGDKAEK